MDPAPMKVAGSFFGARSRPHLIERTLITIESPVGIVKMGNVFVAHRQWVEYAWET